MACHKDHNKNGHLLVKLNTIGAAAPAITSCRARQGLSVCFASAPFQPPPTPCSSLTSEVSAILRDAWEGFKRGFVLAYAGRAGLGVMTRALSLVRRRQFSDALGWHLLSEKNLVYRCCRIPSPKSWLASEGRRCMTLFLPVRSMMQRSF